MAGLSNCSRDHMTRKAYNICFMAPYRESVQTSGLGEGRVLPTIQARNSGTAYMPVSSSSGRMPVASLSPVPPPTPASPSFPLSGCNHGPHHLMDLQQQPYNWSRVTRQVNGSSQLQAGLTNPVSPTLAVLPPFPAAGLPSPAVNAARFF